MAYVIFGVKKDLVSKVNDALKDDLVGRQSITERDASALGMQSELHLVFIEGTDPGISRAREVFKEVGEPLPQKESEEVYKKLKEDEEKAAAGVGMIFDS